MEKQTNKTPVKLPTASVAKLAPPNITKLKAITFLLNSKNNSNKKSILSQVSIYSIHTFEVWQYDMQLKMVSCKGKLNNLNIRAPATVHIIPHSNYFPQCNCKLYVNKLFRSCHLKLSEILRTIITSNGKLLSILLSSFTKAYSSCSIVNTHNFEIALQSHRFNNMFAKFVLCTSGPKLCP